MDCIFCAIVAGEAPSRKVDEDEHWVAFLDVNPVTSGHALVVPRRHADDLFAMDEDGVRHLMAGVHRVAGLLRERLTPAGLNLVQSNGTAAWQTVFHVHVHVLPRYENDGLRPPSPHVPASPDDLAAVHDRIRGGSPRQARPVADHPA